MKTLLIALSAGMVLVVLIYTWANRDSERVVLTFVTAMLLGSVGFITKESISNQVEKFSKEISVAAFFGMPRYQGLNIRLPYSLDMTTYIQEYKESDVPQAARERLDLSYGQDIYFEAIQYAVVRQIAQRYGRGWDVTVRTAWTPNGLATLTSSAQNGGTIVRSRDVALALNLSRVSASGPACQLFCGFAESFMLPPGTRWSVNPERGGHASELILKNRFVSLRIRLEKFTTAVGVGEYTPMFGGGHVQNIVENPTYGHAAYRVLISGEQAWWYNGHPDMASHRRWANSVVELIETTFSYELARSENMTRFQMFGPSAVKEIPDVK